MPRAVPQDSPRERTSSSPRKELEVERLTSSSSPRIPVHPLLRVSPHKPSPVQSQRRLPQHGAALSAQQTSTPRGHKGDAAPVGAEQGQAAGPAARKPQGKRSKQRERAARAVQEQFNSRVWTYLFEGLQR